MLEARRAAPSVFQAEDGETNRTVVMVVMNSGVSGPFLLLLLLLLPLQCSAWSVLGSVVLKKYFYIKKHYTWQDARRYCSSNYTNLAVIDKQSDIYKLRLRQYKAWIGLHKEEANSLPLRKDWIWSNGVKRNFFPWAADEPSSDDGCASVFYRNSRFYGNDCGRYFFFICLKQNKNNNYPYKFIPESKTWKEAQQHCRDLYSDLASLNNNDDLEKALLSQDFPVWTGLHRDGGTWKGSMGLPERDWMPDVTGNGGGDCVSISSKNKRMATQNCLARFPFVCFRDNLVLVREKKTWEEALEHCRALRSPNYNGLFHELVSVRPGEDHDYVVSRVKQAHTAEVWTGLRFLAGRWLWVNGADVLYPDLPVCPLRGQHCGALSKTDGGCLEPRDCSEKRNFLCYRTQV